MTFAHGFNLLPHRQRDARLARRRRYVEWTSAALCGCAAVALLMAWQTFERARSTESARRSGNASLCSRRRLPSTLGLSVRHATSA